MTDWGGGGRETEKEREIEVELEWLAREGEGWIEGELGGGVLAEREREGERTRAIVLL